MSHNKTPFDLNELWVISDNDTFLQRCTASGFKTQALLKIDYLPTQSLVFSFSNEAAKRTFDIAKNTPSKKSIFCATHVFYASVTSALYSLKLIMKSNFYDALERQRSVLTLLDTYKQFHLEGDQSQANVVIAEQATPYAMIKEDITPSYIYSVAEFFEVHYAHMNAQAPCPFTFNGRLKISGILTVLRKQPAAPNPKLKRALKKLVQHVACHTAMLTIENNIITSFVANHIEHKQLLNAAAGPRGLKLTEFAVGVNGAISPCIDYRINSQMNEGISGVHVALGDGSSGYHIDFLSPDVTFNPVHL